MTFWDKVKNGFCRFGNAIATGWHTGWKKLEEVSVPLHKTYEMRDFHGASAFGIWAFILAIVFGFFHLTINLETMRLVIGGSFVRDVGELFTLIAILLIIGGILTTTETGLLFVLAGIALPFVGELLTLIWNLIIGNVGAYFSSSWIYLALYAVILALYALTFFHVIPVKVNRFLFSGCMVVFFVLGILSMSLQFPPFYGFAEGETKTGIATCAFTYVTDAFEYFFIVIAYFFINLAIFGTGDQAGKPVTKVKLKEEKEEF